MVIFFLNVSGDLRRAIPYWLAPFHRCFPKEEETTVEVMMVMATAVSRMIRHPTGHCPRGHFPGRANWRPVEGPQESSRVRVGHWYWGADLNAEPGCEEFPFCRKRLYPFVCLLHSAAHRSVRDGPWIRSR
jgi:hypothetical protein